MSNSSIHHIFPITILETHLDFMGHMNNHAYLRVFEEARWDMVNQRGYGFDMIQKTQQGPVILSIEIQFLKEVRLRQELIVETFMIDYPGKVGKIQQVMRTEQGDIHCSAVFTVGLFDMKARRLIAPTPEWRHACGV